MEGRTLIRQALELGLRTAEFGFARPAKAARAEDLTWKKVNDCVRPLLIIVHSAGDHRADRGRTPEALHGQVASALERLKRQLRKLDLSETDVLDIVYLLVAHVDELMQSHAGILREYWQTHLLQLQQFGDTHGGEGFFERLEQARANGRVPLLLVGYLCLLMGFQGMYSHHGQLERENVIDTVRRALDDHIGFLAPRPLSPAARRPNEPSTDRKSSRLLQLLAMATAALGVLWYSGLWFSIDARGQSLRAHLTFVQRELTLGE